VRGLARTEKGGPRLSQQAFSCQHTRAMPFSLKRPEGPPVLAHTYRQYEIGPHSYGWVIMQDFGVSTSPRIGDYCSFAEQTLILVGGEHRRDWVTTDPFPARWPEGKGIRGHPATRGDIVIGNDVWVGVRATILSGVTVGHGQQSEPAAWSLSTFHPTASPPGIFAE